METLLATLGGIAIILIALRDIVRELFHPEDTGSISRFVMQQVWHTVRAIAKRRRSALFHAGPIVLVCVAAVWTLMLVVGFALIYWPRLPDDFHVASGLPSGAIHGFMPALYVSGATLASLGSSDISPVVTSLRIANVIEGLVGLMLITAWITWTLSIYPVIADRRAFTREVLLLRQTAPPESVREPPAEATVETLRALSEQILHLGSQLHQSRVTYYFQNESPDVSLATQLPWVLRYARTAEAESSDALVRRHGALLRHAVEQVVRELGEQFLNVHDAPAEEVIAKLAEDHLLPLDAEGRQRSSTSRAAAGRY